MDYHSIAVLFNFSLLIVVLYFATRKTFREFMVQRHVGIKTEIAEAHTLSGNAQSLLSKFQQAFSGKEKEIESQKTDLEHRLEKYKKESVEQAHRDSERIRKEAQLLGGSEVAKQKSRIEHMILHRSLADAKSYLKENVKEEEESMFFQSFLKTGLGDNHGK